MKVYKYLDANWGRVALKEKEFKISRILELNDPFEFMSIAPKNKIERQLFRKTLENLNEEMGVISFSKVWDIPLMWSHYGEKHKGICLEFDVSQSDNVDERILHEVQYDRYRKAISFDSNVFSDTRYVNILNKLSHTKHTNWKYEKELRILPKLSDSNLNNSKNLYFRKFGIVHHRQNLLLTRIFLGPRYEDDTIVLPILMKAFKIPVITTRLAFNSYNIIIQKLKSMQVKVNYE